MMRIRVRIKQWSLCALLLLSVGCTGGLVSKPIAQRVHELGVPQARDASRSWDEVVLAVSEPSWLSTTAMQYRHEGVAATERRYYSESRWAAKPAEMLENALKASLTTSNFGGNCRLQLDLKEFIQSFDNSHDSTVELRVQATFSSKTANGIKRASRHFDLRQPGGADAGAGVLALRQAQARLGADLEEWLQQLVANQLAFSQCAPTKS